MELPAAFVTGQLVLRWRDPPLDRSVPRLPQDAPADGLAHRDLRLCCFPTFEAVWSPLRTSLREDHTTEFAFRESGRKHRSRAHTHESLCVDSLCPLRKAPPPHAARALLHKEIKVPERLGHRLADARIG